MGEIRQSLNSVGRDLTIFITNVDHITVPVYWKDCLLAHKSRENHFTFTLVESTVQSRVVYNDSCLFRLHFLLLSRNVAGIRSVDTAARNRADVV